MSKLVFFAGSIRKDSLNKKLAQYACQLAQEYGADATLVDLADYDMPIYNGDWETENGLPEAAKKLKGILADADGFFIASPEYNGSFSALLKNTIDWLSRPHEENEPGLKAFKGKVAAICAASPGGLGGMRGLVPLRLLLGNIGVTVLPDQLAVGKAFEAFDDQGALVNEKYKETLTDIVKKLM